MNDKILRLSLFNLKKNRREVLGIIFMTMVTVLMLSVVLINQKKIDTSFDESFTRSGCVRQCVLFKVDKYRNAFPNILQEDYGIEKVSEGRMIFSSMVDVLNRDGDTVAYNLIYATEKAERKMEAFRKLGQLPEEEIARLEHPIWLPEGFRITKGYSAGDDFVILKNGKEYPFIIAGFYESGLMTNDGYSHKVILSEDDYALFAMLFDSASDYECVGLFFDGEEIDFDRYLEDCNKVASENLSFTTHYNCFRFEKINETTFLEIFMMMIIGISAVTLIASLFMIRHKISGDIEDQMQQIGVLEALGYRSAEISLSYLYEYVIAGGSGSVLGAVIACLITPFVNTGISILLGRSISGSSGTGGAVIAAAAVLFLVVLFALLKARRVKNYPPVVALRKGIRTHHFGKNIMPLDKMHWNINLGLAMKGFFSNLKASAGILICIITAGTAILFASLTYDFSSNGPYGFAATMGTDWEVLKVYTLSDADINAFRKELLTLPEVRKAINIFSGEHISVKGSADSAEVISFGDYADSENIHPYEGRLPQYENEVMVGLKRSRKENIKVGDSIVLELNGLEKTYIVTGIVGTMQNGGTVVYLTNDGYKRLNIFAAENVVQVYPAEAVSIPELQAAIDAHFGGTAKQTAEGGSSGQSREEKIRAAAEEKIATMLNQYGVTDVDYAVQIGDELIKGNSRNFVIKEYFSYEGIIKTQMVPISETTNSFCFYALILVSGIVAVLITIITSNDVRRQRHALGIMKGLGYSSKDLMLQLALKYMPVILAGTAIATICGLWINDLFWGLLFAAFAKVNISTVVVTDILLLIFCFAVAYLSAGRIRKISVTELMTE
ncbi:MAG: ABC transporter permease [Lachnospiraceae bacterium]|nr:ABC transporter permease [Lachnospiraceae bacterium]